LQATAFLFQGAANCRLGEYGWNTSMRSSCTWIILTFALLLSACSDAGSRRRKAPKPFTDFDALAIEQSACLFDCPVFEVTIFSDGRVLYSGPTFDYRRASLGVQEGLCVVARSPSRI
jgi:hypothetical protein